MTYHVTTGQMTTGSNVTAVRGIESRLPCPITREPVALFWHQHNNEDIGTSRIVAKFFNGKLTNEAPRFNITDDYSLVISNISVQDEKVYSCQVIYRGSDERNYTYLRVIGKEVIRIRII